MAASFGANYINDVSACIICVPYIDVIRPSGLVEIISHSIWENKHGSLRYPAQNDGSSHCGMEPAQPRSLIMIPNKQIGCPTNDNRIKIELEVGNKPDVLKIKFIYRKSFRTIEDFEITDLECDES